jgi:hypothetical protein
MITGTMTAFARAPPPAGEHLQDVPVGMGCDEDEDNPRVDERDALAQSALTNELGLSRTVYAGAVLTGHDTDPEMS